MKVAIISDTHENETEIIKAVSIIKELGINTVFHCGDLISPPMLEYFKGLDFYFVFGNNDGEKEWLTKNAKKLGFHKPEQTLNVEIDGKKIFVCHESYKYKKALESKEYDFIFYGHSHSAEERIERETLVLNPGALFRSQVHTFATLDLKNKKVEFHKF